MRKYLPEVLGHARTVTALVVAMLPFGAAAEFKADVPGATETLPAVYPDHWVMASDLSSLSTMLEGRVIVVDPLAPDTGGQFKGMMTASFIAAFQTSAARGEHYVIESFHSRGGRGGTRQDFVSVYDPSTLTVKDEIEIPSGRITGMPKTLSTAMIGDDRFIGVYNFTPSQTVSIVDLEAKTFVGEVPIAGCSFLLPSGDYSFSSICSDGSFLTTTLDDSGAATSTQRSPVVFDANDDPVFEGPGITDDAAYFLTFSGQILPVDTSGEIPDFGEKYWLSDESERNWLPGGANPIATDADGMGYVLMNPEGGEGTHKDGGAQVWVVDLAKGNVQSKIDLQTWGVSLGTSGKGDSRLLYVTNAELGIDVYRIPQGEFVHTLNIGAGLVVLYTGAQ
ncbi:MAG: amine dehydrogenase large subunit [Pseudomonadota bacterium]